MGESNSIENHFDGRAGGDVQQIAINVGTVVSGGNRQPVGHKFSTLDQPFYNQTEPAERVRRLIGTRDPIHGVRVLVSGLTEVGKTALASRVIGGLQDDLPVIPVFLDRFRGKDGQVSRDIVRDVLVGDGVAPQIIPESPAGQRSLLETRTSEGPVLIFVDGALSGAEVELFYPAGRGSALVVTSPSIHLDDFPLPADRIVRIDPLTVEHSATMLVDLCEWLGEEPRETVRELAALSHGYPANLQRIAAHLRRYGKGELDRYLEHLRNDQGIRQSFKRTFKLMSRGGRNLYRLLGMIRVPDFDIEFVQLLLGCNYATAYECMDELVNLCLINVDRSGRSWMRPEVWQYAAHRFRKSTSAHDRRAELRRVLNAHLSIAHAADVAVLTEDRLRVATRGRIQPCDRFRDEGGKQRALDWLAANRILLQWLVDEAAAHGLPRQAWQLVEALTALYVNQGHVDDWIKYTLIGVRAAHADGDLAAVARLSSFGTRPLVQRCRFEEARSALAEALRLAREDGDLRLCASVHERIGRYRAAVGEAIAAGTVIPDGEIDGSAIAAYLRAEELFIAARDRRGELIVRMYRGQSLGEDGSADALPTLRAALSGFEDTGESRMVGRCWASIGVVQRGLGDVEASATSLLEAVAILSTGGDSVYEYEARAELATTAELAGDADLARDNARRRHELEIELGVAVPAR